MVAFFLAVGGGEVDLVFAVEKEEVGDDGAFFGVAGKAVDVDFFALVVGAVEAFEESAVEERDVGEGGEGGVGVVEFGFVAVEVVDAVGVAVGGEALVEGEGAIGFAFAVFAHALVEGGEEEVLEDGLIVGGALGVEILEESLEVGWMEEGFGDEAFFFEEPAEDEAGEQADEAGGVALFLVGFDIVGKADLAQGPEVPVGKFFVEAFVEEFDVEDLLPGGVEGIEAVDALLFGVDEVGQGKGAEDVQVSAVGGGEADVADDGDFAEHVFFRFAFVGAAVDDGDGEDLFFLLPVLDEHHDGHGEDAVDLPGDGGEFAAGVVGSAEFQREEEVGVEVALFDLVFVEEVGFSGQIPAGELEKEFDAFPIGHQGFVAVQFGAVGIEMGEEAVRLTVQSQGAVAAVPEGAEQIGGRLAEGAGLEGLEGGLDGGAVVGHGAFYQVSA